MSSEPASATRKRVGANVREYRVNAGMSISEVSERMGVSQHDLEMIESGQAGLWDVHAIDRLAECCSLSLVQKKRLHDLAGVDKNASLAASARIFISYRRDDQAALAGRLYDKLAARFGDAQVFVDVCSIETGVDYYDVLERALSQCQVLLAVIGKDWVTATGRDGKRRLDDPGDLVRVEIETVLKRNIRVIPILVEGTQMPRAEDLPESLKLLARRNGQSIVHERFAADVSALISTLERILAAPDKAQAETSDADALSARNRQDSDSPKVYSSNEFNVALTTEIRQIWWNRFNEKIHMELNLDNTKEPSGGFDGMIWPLGNPDAKMAVKTFPSPNERLRSSVALESLKGKDAPCLIVTRLPLKEWTRSAIEQSYPPPVQFLHWTGSDEDKEALERSLHTLREALN